MTTDNPNLSDREIEILNLLGQGKSNKDIAQELFISINTVKVHVNNIYKKLGVSSRTEATIYGIEHGLIENPRSEAELVHIHVPSPDPGEPVEEKKTFFLKYWWALIFVGITIVIILSVLIWNDSLFPDPTPTINPLINTLHQERWRELQEIPTPRKRMAIAVWDNAIYAIGGQTSVSISGVVERFVSTTNNWERLNPKPTPVMDAGAATLGGKIYVPGGQLADGSLTAVTEVFEPRTNRWSRASDLPTPMSRYGITVFEGNLYLFGGWDGKNYLSEVWVYSPISDVWQSMSSMPLSRSDMSVITLGEDVYIFGGECEAGPCLQSYVYSPYLEDSEVEPWKAQLTLEEDIEFLGAEAVSGSIFIFGKDADGVLQLNNYTPQNNIWYTYAEERKVFPASEAQLIAIGNNVFFLGGTSTNGVPSEKIIRYQAVFTIVLPNIGN